MRVCPSILPPPVHPLLLGSGCRSSALAVRNSGVPPPAGLTGRSLQWRWLQDPDRVPPVVSFYCPVTERSGSAAPGTHGPGVLVIEGHQSHGSSASPERRPVKPRACSGAVESSVPCCGFPGAARHTSADRCPHRQQRPAPALCRSRGQPGAARFIKPPPRPSAFVWALKLKVNNTNPW